MAYRGHCTVNNCKDSQQPELRAPIETKQGIAKAQHQTSLESRHHGKTRTGTSKGKGFLLFFSFNTCQLGRWASISSLPHPLLLQEHALPSLLRPAKINTFITTLCFLMLVAIVFHLSLSQVSSRILVELFISIFTAHLWQTEKIRCKEKLKWDQRKVMKEAN